MNPTSRELIDAIAETLRTRIAPLLADQPWPASELRTIDALLAHLAARVEHERDVLLADDADLDTLLAELHAAGIEVDVDVTSDDNLARRAALERAIHLVHDGDHAEQVASIRAYLVRAAARDALVYGPLSGRPLF